jgi:hypothetical protein
MPLSSRPMLQLVASTSMASRWLYMLIRHKIIKIIYTALAEPLAPVNPELWSRLRQLVSRNL